MGALHTAYPRSPAISTTTASRNLSKALRCVIRSLLAKDKEFLETHGTRRCWITLSPDEVAHYLKNHVAALAGLYPATCDFTSMYTNLDHTVIKTNVRKAVMEAMKYGRNQLPGLRAPAMYLVQDEDESVRWSRNSGPGLALSMEDVFKHIDFIVDNTFLMTQDGTIRHQRIGLPMGTNASPELANLTLYATEAQYIDDLIQEGRIQEARQHVHTKRFIDDLMTWNTLPPPSALYGLEWTATTNEDRSATFLGITATPLNTGLQLGVFDKAASWSFPVIRYPSPPVPHPMSQPTKQQVSIQVSSPGTRAYVTHGRPSSQLSSN